MSGGIACACDERKKRPGMRNWGITQYLCNHSAFSGYKKTFSSYSAVRCFSCGACWRTNADYVNDLRFTKFNDKIGNWELKSRVRP